MAVSAVGEPGRTSTQGLLNVPGQGAPLPSVASEQNPNPSSCPKAAGWFAHSPRSSSPQVQSLTGIESFLLLCQADVSQPQPSLSPASAGLFPAVLSRSRGSSQPCLIPQVSPTHHLPPVLPIHCSEFPTSRINVALQTSHSGGHSLQKAWQGLHAG